MIQISKVKVTEDVHFISFSIEDEFSVTFSNLGSAIYGIKFSDKNKNYENVTLIPDNPLEWIKERTYSGAVVAPLAGRYHPRHTSLEQNRAPLHFHGGTAGYDKQLWRYTIQQTEDTAQLIFSFSDRKNQLEAEVCYSLTLSKQLTMEITARTERTAFFNPTNHIYFNLNGNLFDSVESHSLYLDSTAYYLENEQKLISGLSSIPTNSQWDFTQPTGKSLSNLAAYGGLDTTFKLGEKKEGLIRHKKNGRAVRIKTTLPAAVIFTFNQEQPAFSIDGRCYPRYAGITFETQLPANDLEAALITIDKPYYAKTSYTFLHI
ncbi:hypothetical protein [Enterococcus sp. LJL51]|uniref:aldose epimerase family protein n=1 Tax=Enterococcus sp. LJL51 TaxID=3416656 RepID=UPI003CF42E1E